MPDKKSGGLKLGGEKATSPAVAHFNNRLYNSAAHQGSSSSLSSGPTLPDQFLKGVGLSVWQNSADGDSPAPSNWQTFARKKGFFGRPELENTAWRNSNGFWDG